MTATIRHPASGKTMTTPIIVAMDPGAQKGYALLDPAEERCRKSWDAPRVVAQATTLAELVEQTPGHLLRRPVWAVVEFQYAQRVSSGEISADSIIKLAFRAGYMLREAVDLLGAEEHFAVVPQKWKSELYPTGSNIRKEVFTGRLLRELFPDEVARLRVIEENDDKDVDDVLDAVGIGWALWHVTAFPQRWKTWRCEPEHIIPIERKRSRRKLFQAAVNSTAFQPKDWRK